MRIAIRSSFERDTKKLLTENKNAIFDAILLMQKAVIFADIPGIKNMKGGKKAKDAYRMRIGNFRICFYFRHDIIELVRVLPRKDVYKVFP